MNQTRIRKSIDGQKPVWPTTVRAAIPFSSVDDQHPRIAVYCLDYAIFTVLQVTNTGKEAFTVRSLVVNGEFRPAFGVANISDQFFRLRFPLDLGCGLVLSAVLRAPATRTAVSSCYPKLPESLLISTDHGDFIFNAGEVISPSSVSSINQGNRMEI